MNKMYTLLLILITLLIAAVLKPLGIPFGVFDIAAALKILTILFVIFLFQERALDVFLTIIRAPDSEEMKRKLEKLKNEPESPERYKVIEDLEKKLSDYKIATRNLAMKLGYFLGFIIAMIGIRSLEPMIDLDHFVKISSIQQSAFRVVDVFITGGLLAGGSDGIHKIIEILRDFRLKVQQ